MSISNATVLVVDDQQINLDLIVEYLEDIGLQSVTATDGAQAWELLQQYPDRFSAVLLDRMMPNMDGMEVLEKIKSDPVLNMLPVIMQTAKVSQQDMLEGLQAGAYYYLTKPYEQQHLLAIVKTAVDDNQRYTILQESTRQTSKTLKMMEQGEFSFKTLEQGRNLAILLANACPDADKVVLGLTELMVNAVEHGNLGISYDEKSSLNANGEWQQEIENRLGSEQYAGKFASVQFERKADALHFKIVDQGTGFNWQQYLDFSPERAFDSHGRGIAMANSVSFDSIQYCGNGNEVEVSVKLAV